MQVTVQNVLIDRDMVTKLPKQLWNWELPVMEAKFPDGKVQLRDAEQIEISELPDVDVEYERLTLAHGTDGGQGGTNLSYVELAYGRGREGKKRMASVIKASTKAPRKPRKKASTKPEPTPQVEAGEGDPLDMG